LRRDGAYWFELENRGVIKKRVKRLLAKFGVNPDNMLIIMHQNMVEEFTVLSPQEKLKTMEAAVGLEPYRRNVLEAQRKLSRILSQAESVDNLLKSAEQTLNYWREQYDRYQEKRQLRMKRRFLERELVWAKVIEKEKVLSGLKDQFREENSKLRLIEHEIENITGQLSKVEAELEQSKRKWSSLLEQRLAAEREKAKQELTVSYANQALKEERGWKQTANERMKEFVSGVEQLETLFNQDSNPANVGTYLGELKQAYTNLRDTVTQYSAIKIESLRKQMEYSSEELTKLNSHISGLETEMQQVNTRIDDARRKVLDYRVNQAISLYRKEKLAESLNKLDKMMKKVAIDLEEGVKEAEEFGSRLVPTRGVGEIFDAIRVTDGHLAALVDVSETVEKMYESYSKKFLELEEKAQLVAENREKALVEVKTRMRTWRNVVEELLSRVRFQYQKILEKVQAIGDVQLVNGGDIEAAGLELLVGFKGGKPVALTAYTQSGGERSTATMSFLFALQQHVRSPFRAVDEYDVHMDPKNRELIADLLVSCVKGTDAQYLAITPSQITFAEKDVHIVTVQNVEGSSIIYEVS
jgi:chromosome segregation ATPase